jgi:hypothetical protein
MSIEATPPAWAEALLRDVLRPADGDSVTGDLLEEYRESIHPVRGPWRADVWYVGQVLGFVWRDARLWGTLFGVAFVARTALDWLLPPADFHVRASVSTYLGVTLLLTSAFLAARRSGSSAAGMIAGVATASIGAAISIAGATALLAIWHDSQTIAAIRGSGGLGEVFTLPIMMVLPGLVLGIFGGIAGVAVRRLRST